MIIVIGGPTAVGKTKLSIELAKRYNAEIINYDSVQVYKDMDIVSAKVTKDEMEGIPHHLLDIKEYNEEYTVYDYQKDARNIIDDLLSKNKNIIMVGGTGLYIKAALYDYKFYKEDNNNYNELSNEELYNRIISIDNNVIVDKNNKRRLVRTLANLNNEGIQTDGDKLLYDNVLFIGLETDRDNLYDRINKRVDMMLQNGLEDEARYFYNKEKTKAIMTPIGYKELFMYFDIELSKEEAINMIKQNSRHYAKRQFTWYRNKMNMKWFNTDYNNFDNTINEVIKYIEKEIS